MFGPIALLGEKQREGFADEIGIVTDMYYMQTEFDPDQVLTVNLGMEDGAPLRKYIRHRTRLTCTPFNRLEARRIWGAGSPIELFLMQGLLQRGHSPTLQMLLYDDGSTYPCLYHLWAESNANTPGFITESDFFFPEQRVAVFCDSTRHHRSRKAAKKDYAINDRLAAAGFTPVRVPGSLIVRDIDSAVAMVCEALE
ncbi:hypothetical protein IZ6_01810 [Terrihabitans soli]|uniref:DUF559 domain-containing protein n=1 Tax=Terrihabitans soli TaxID=708113 RepID=A0A6S6QJP0_9HYPH|nr:endonuclease domain-containing protein [Terrihabitans soli]BCJ89446.1 hypothetical protein IZ6_01810 [Terrihabitans soli]